MSIILDTFPFTRLPPELRRCMLRCTARSDGSLEKPISPGDQSSLLTISHVCQEWRDIAWTEFKLWETVQLSTPEHASALLSLLAKDTELEEKAAGGAHSADFSASSSADLGARITSLAVGEDVSQGGPDPGAGLRQSYPLTELLVACPNVEVLWLRGAVDEAARGWIQSPNLHSLRLTSCQIMPATPRPCCSNITELSIIHTSVHPSFRDWLSDGSFPNLGALAFNRNASEKPFVVFTPLGELLVAGCETLPFDSLPHIPHANLQSLFIGETLKNLWSGETHSGNKIATLLNDNSLALFDCHESLADAPELLARLPPTLKYLRLRGMCSERVETPLLDDPHDGQGEVHDKVISVVRAEVTKGRLRALKSVYHPLGWTVRAGYQTLKSVCEQGGVELVAEPLIVDDDSADTRFWALVRKLEA